MIKHPKDFFDQVKNLCEEVGLQLAEVFRRLDTTTSVGATKVELEAGLAKKAEKQHSHPISDVNGLQASLDNKLDKTANAVSASKWQTARKLTLSGDVSGEVTVDGSGDVTVTTAVVDDSHNHVIGNVDGLQAALDAKLAAATYNTDKPTFATKATTYTKTEVDAKVASVYRPKGSVASYDALPASAAIGDVYNLLSTGANYVWTDNGWDKLSETVDLTPYMLSETANSTFLTKTSASSTYATQVSLNTVSATATTAKSTADTASTTATQAKTAATAAQTAATTAQTAAEKAAADASAASEAAQAAAAEVTGKVDVVGDRGKLAGYCQTAHKVYSLTVNANSNDVIVYDGDTDINDITVENGASGTAWTKVIAIGLSNAVTITFGDKWAWVNGDAPELEDNSLIVLVWTSNFGTASFVSRTG